MSLGLEGVLAIVVATNPSVHIIFDAAAWISALISGVVVRRSGLSVKSPPHTYSTGYLACLAAGAILGAYATGSLPALLRGQSSIGHSVAGALAGAIFGVEAYKFWRGE